MTPPGVWFTYTPDRKSLHLQQHLESFSGTLQADAYGGYRAIYETGRVTEAACWANARRQFYELHAARPNALNTEALQRIGALYKIEQTIRGKPPDERRAYRQAQFGGQVLPSTLMCTDIRCPLKFWPVENHNTPLRP
jgi:transposase